MTDVERIQRAEALQQIWQHIIAALLYAEHKHPIWPGVGYRGDHVRTMAKLQEEVGEVQKAINEYDEGRGSLFHIEYELYQTGAMVVRNLLNLEAVERQRVNESARQDLQDEHNVYLEKAEVLLVGATPATNYVANKNDWEWHDTSITSSAYVEDGLL